MSAKPLEWHTANHCYDIISLCHPIPSQPWWFRPLLGISTLSLWRPIFLSASWFFSRVFSRAAPWHFLFTFFIHNGPHRDRIWHSPESSFVNGAACPVFFHVLQLNVCLERSHTRFCGRERLSLWIPSARSLLMFLLNKNEWTPGSWPHDLTTVCF